MPSFALDISSPNAPPARQPLAGQNLILGRGHDAHIFLDSKAISRRHAQLSADPFGRWWIRDLGSHNGTLLNGARVTEQLLKPGDLLQLGEFSLTLAALDESPIPAAATASVSIVESDHPRTSALRDFETPRLAATHLSILSDFGQQLQTLDDPAQRLTALCRLMVRPEFHATAAVVLRASKVVFTDPPKPLCDPQCAGDGQAAAPYISKSLIRTLLARNEPILASNCSAPATAPGTTAPNVSDLSIAADVLSTAAVACPLKSEPAYSDLLYVLFPPNFGTCEWLALTSLAVKQFAQSESAWAARKLGENHASIERELSRAHDIQKRLVPRNIQIPGLDYAIGFTPCRWVGGDYVDLIKAGKVSPAPGPAAAPADGGGGRVLLTIADVCGKGLPAALVASSLHMLTHTAMRTHTPLTDIMRNLNIYLSENLTPGSFVTMLAALLDLSTGTLEIINAGHPAGFFLTPDGALQETQNSANCPLGLDPNAELVADTSTLPHGSYLVLFTDGLSELHIEGGQLLGEDALGTYLAHLIRNHHRDSPDPCAPPTAADLAAKLTTLLDSLQEGMATDDRTFLLARRV